MTGQARIVRAEPLEPHWLRLWFVDGSVHEVDVGSALLRLRPIVDVYSNPDLFNQVVVGSWSIEWPGGLDLDPDVLHGDYEPADGEPYPRRVIRGPREGQTV